MNSVLFDGAVDGDPNELPSCRQRIIGIVPSPDKLDF